MPPMQNRPPFRPLVGPQAQPQQATTPPRATGGAGFAFGGGSQQRMGGAGAPPPGPQQMPQPGPTRFSGQQQRPPMMPSGARGFAGGFAQPPPASGQNATAIMPTITAQGSQPGLPPTPPKAAQDNSPWGQIEGLHNDIMQAHQNSWADTEKGLAANAAMQQRRNAEINAGMGRSIGGGFWGGQAMANIGAQQNELNARNQFNKEGQNLQMDWLDKVLQRNNRLEDLQNQAAQTESGVPGGGKPAPEGSVDEILNRTIDGGNGWTSLNAAQKTYGWSRSQLDAAKKVQAEFFQKYGYFLTTEGLENALQNGFH